MKWAEQQAIVERSKRGYIPEKAEPVQQVSLTLRGGEVDVSTIYITVKSSDTAGTIADDVISRLGTNKIGLLVFCETPMSIELSQNMVSNLNLAKKMSNHLSIVRIPDSKEDSINKVLKKYKSNVGSGAVAVIFKRQSQGYTREFTDPGTVYSEEVSERISVTVHYCYLYFPIISSTLMPIVKHVCKARGKTKVDTHNNVKTITP